MVWVLWWINEAVLGAEVWVQKVHKWVAVSWVQKRLGWVLWCEFGC